MLNLMMAVFLIGYVLIALEHTIKVNKAAIALVTGTIMWAIYVMGASELAPVVSPEEFKAFLDLHPAITSLPFAQQCVKFIAETQVLEQIGEISETLFFLIGAMTIVELIDVHGGFSFVTNRIRTKSKTKLLWIIAGLTFFMSAVLDNMTTAIVMVMLIKRMIANYKERWIYASIIIISANSGGAWSPIGDVTTIMLWVNGNVTTGALVPALIVPCLVSTIIPTFIASRLLNGVVQENSRMRNSYNPGIIQVITRGERISIFVLGVACLLFVPLFKMITSLPPFMGILLTLGIMWVYTEMMYDRKPTIEESLKHRVPQVLRRIDTPTILFFLGILMAVGALQNMGVLGSMAQFLDKHLHNVYIINLLIGLLSSIVDNVPIVAASMGMYDLVDPVTAAAMAPGAYQANFVVDGVFWEFLAYCAGVGGSILVIGSVSGVVVMGIEKISFSWYLKNISLMALVGYLAGAGVYWLQNMLLGV